MTPGFDRTDAQIRRGERISDNLETAMKSCHSKIAAALMACAALASHSAAAAADCTSQKDMSDLVVYAVPYAIDGARAKCGTTLGQNSFLMKNGDTVRSRYAALADAAWPGAKQAMTALGDATGRGTSMGFLELLGPKQLRDTISAMLPGMIAGQIKGLNCSDIDRGLALTADIAPQKLGDLAGFAAMVALKDKKPKCTNRTGQNN